MGLPGHVLVNGNSKKVETVGAFNFGVVDFEVRYVDGFLWSMKSDAFCFGYVE